MTIRAGRHQTPRRGFNLIESAIVLGVVGVVLGALWVTASAVMERWKVNRVSEALLQIDQEARKLFPPQLWPSAPGGSTSTTYTLIKIGAVPKDMVLRSNEIANIISPEGRITTSLLYPPLTSRRMYYFHLSLIKNTKTANLFLSTFISASSKTGKFSHCFCIKCKICDGSHNLSSWSSSGSWPPACPDLLASDEKLSIACYLNE